MTSNDSHGEAVEYEIATVFYAWESDGVRYRRGKTRDGRDWVQRGDPDRGRWVLDHIHD